MPNMTLKNGDLSAYALGCGYIQRRILSTADGRAFELTLSHNGATFDVDIRIADDSVPREWIDMQDGSRILAGWAQFDQLGNARRFFARMLRATNLGDAYAACIAVMS